MNGRRLPFADRASFVAAHGWAAAETLLVLAVFFVQGAAPTPDVNEPYYLGKAVHYWNPDWARGDFFLNTADTHEVFYYTFGWLSLWLPLKSLAWVGRILTWSLLAWAWRRMSFAVLPRRGWAVLTAALMVCLVERFHMAGEWIVGGVEAKGFAFVLVLLGIEAMVRGRWNRAWLLLGAASAFHVLVGGWSVVAAAVAWGICRRMGRSSADNKVRLPGEGDRAASGRPVPRLGLMLPAVFGGLLISLPGLVPALTLNWGVDAETMATANLIYVFRRLQHHLDPGQIPALWIVRFVLLGALWLWLCRAAAVDAPRRRFRAFVAGAVVISLVGTIVFWWSLLDMRIGAALLRYYWFRLADVIVPVGVALEAVWFALERIPSRRVFGRAALAAAILAATVHIGVRLARLPSATVPPAYRLSARADDFRDWRDACRWVAESGQIAPDAQFITPVMTQTFKWYAGRGEVANWKEIPQDARAIVAWGERIVRLDRAARRPPPDGSLPDLRTERLRELGAVYGAEYVVAAAHPRLELPVVYENKSYVIYRIAGDQETVSGETTGQP